MKLQDGKHIAAEGKNSNPLFSYVDTNKPIVKDKSKLMQLDNEKSFVIDFETVGGKTYVLKWYKQTGGLNSKL